LRENIEILRKKKKKDLDKKKARELERFHSECRENLKEIERKLRKFEKEIEKELKRELVKKKVWEHYIELEEERIK